MIYRKLVALLASQFNIIPENLNEESVLDDLGLDLVELAMALEETFELDHIEDLTSYETMEELVDFIQTCLDM